MTFALLEFMKAIVEECTGQNEMPNISSCKLRKPMQHVKTRPPHHHHMTSRQNGGLLHLCCIIDFFVSVFVQLLFVFCFCFIFFTFLYI